MTAEVVECPMHAWMEGAGAWGLAFGTIYLLISIGILVLIVLAIMRLFKALKQ